MKNVLKNYFHYSKRERNGIFVLAFLCVIGLLIPRIYQQFRPVDPAVNFIKFKKEIEAFEELNKEKEIVPIIKTSKLFYFDPNTVTKAELEELGLPPQVGKTLLNFRLKGGRFFKKEDLKKIYGITAEDYERLEAYIELGYKKVVKKEPAKVKTENTLVRASELFEFDPNVAGKETLQQLGFSERAANNLLKFRAKGGTIRRKEDIAKIYGVGEELFEKLLPYIILEIKTESLVSIPKPKETEKRKDNVVVDINAASVEDWQKLRGIGPFYAKRIVNFREKLGGFYAIHQVADTYNLPDSTFQQIQSQLKLNQPPQKMKLNTITVEALAKHPYLKYQEAKVIINYRKQHGSYKTINDLKNIIILSPELLEKIEPYLSFE